MKKTALLMLMIMMVLSFAACGGGDDDGANQEAVDEREVIGFIKVAIPDGWSYDDNANPNTNQVNIVENDGDKTLQFLHYTGTAEEARDKSLDFWKGSGNETREDIGEKTFGDYTYLALGYKWNDMPSMTLYLDDPFDDKRTIMIDCLEIAPDDPILEEILGTITYVEDEN